MNNSVNNQKKERIKRIIRLLLAIAIMIGIGVGIYFILWALGLKDAENIKDVVASTGAWGPIVFVLLQIAVSTLLSVVPGTNMMFIVAGALLFDAWQAILLSLIGVWISSFLMFLIGKLLGEKAVIKIIGEEDLRKAQRFLDTKSKIYLPIMFLFPFFPDDALCLAAGLTKMKYRFFIIVVLIFRSIGVIVSTLVAEGTIGDYKDFLAIDSFRTIDWLIVGNFIILDAYFIFKFSRWLEKKIATRLEKNPKLLDDENIVNNDHNQE